MNFKAIKNGLLILAISFFYTACEMGTPSSDSTFETNNGQVTEEQDLTLNSLEAEKVKVRVPEVKKGTAGENILIPIQINNLLSKKNSKKGSDSFLENISVTIDFDEEKVSPVGAAVKYGDHECLLNETDYDLSFENNLLGKLTIKLKKREGVNKSSENKEKDSGVVAFFALKVLKDFEVAEQGNEKKVVSISNCQIDDEVVDVIDELEEDLEITEEEEIVAEIEVLIEEKIADRFILINKNEEKTNGAAIKDEKEEKESSSEVTEEKSNNGQGNSNKNETAEKIDDANEDGVELIATSKNEKCYNENNGNGLEISDNDNGNNSSVVQVKIKKPNKIEVLHKRVKLQCCAKLEKTFSYDKENRLITLMFKDVSQEACDCLCTYRVSWTLQVESLGKYNLKILNLGNQEVLWQGANYVGNCSNNDQPVCAGWKDYSNECKALQAGVDADEIVLGPCSEIVCSQEYAPVCAIVQTKCLYGACPKTRESFYNLCEAKKKYGQINEVEYLEGECSQNFLFKVEPLEEEVSREEGRLTFQVEADDFVFWFVRTETDWLSITSNSSWGNGELVVSYDANKGLDRVGEIIVQVDDEVDFLGAATEKNDNLVKIIKIYQAGDNQAPVPGNSGLLEAKVEVDQNNPFDGLLISWTKAEDKVSEASSLEYVLSYQSKDSLDSKWIDLAVLKGDEEPSYLVEGLSYNTAYIFKLVVRDKVGNESSYQLLEKVFPPDVGLAKNNFEVLPNPVFLDWELGEKIISVKTKYNLFWEAVSHNSWLKVEKSGENLGSSQFKITFLPNYDDGQREGLITIQADDLIDSSNTIAFVKEIKVVQEGMGPCPIDSNPVCANGITYDNDCLALKNEGPAADIVSGICPDTEPPEFANGNFLAVETVETEDEAFLYLSWEKAEDNVTPQRELEYNVYYQHERVLVDGKYYLPQDMRTKVYGSYKDISNVSIKGLIPNSSYYFYIKVRDEAGNENFYKNCTVTFPVSPHKEGQIFQFPIKTVYLNKKYGYFEKRINIGLNELSAYTKEYQNQSDVDFYLYDAEDVNKEDKKATNILLADKDIMGVYRWFFEVKLNSGSDNNLEVLNLTWFRDQLPVGDWRLRELGTEEETSLRMDKKNEFNLSMKGEESRIFEVAYQADTTFMIKAFSLNPSEIDLNSSFKPEVYLGISKLFAETIPAPPAPPKYGVNMYIDASDSCEEYYNKWSSKVLYNEDSSHIYRWRIMVDPNGNLGGNKLQIAELRWDSSLLIEGKWRLKQLELGSYNTSNLVYVDMQSTNKVEIKATKIGGHAQFFEVTYQAVENCDVLGPVCVGEETYASQCEAIAAGFTKDQISQGSCIENEVEYCAFSIQAFSLDSVLKFKPTVHLGISKFVAYKTLGPPSPPPEYGVDMYLDEDYLNYVASQSEDYAYIEGRGKFNVQLYNESENYIYKWIIVVDPNGNVSGGKYQTAELRWDPSLLVEGKWRLKQLEVSSYDESNLVYIDMQSTDKALVRATQQGPHHQFFEVSYQAVENCDELGPVCVGEETYASQCEAIAAGFTKDQISQGSCVSELVKITPQEIEVDWKAGSQVISVLTDYYAWNVIEVAPWMTLDNSGFLDLTSLKRGDGEFTISYGSNCGETRETKIEFYAARLTDCPESEDEECNVKNTGLDSASNRYIVIRQLGVGDCSSLGKVCANEITYDNRCQALAEGISENFIEDGECKTLFPPADDIVIDDPVNEERHFEKVPGSMNSSDYAGYVQGMDVVDGKDEVAIFAKNNEGNEVLLGSAVIGDLVTEAFYIIFNHDLASQEGVAFGSELYFKVYDKSLDKEYLVKTKAISYQEEFGLLKPDYFSKEDQSTVTLSHNGRGGNYGLLFLDVSKVLWEVIPSETELLTSNFLKTTTFTTDIKISNVNDLGGVEFIINFDPSLLRVKKVINGEFLTSTGKTILDAVAFSKYLQGKKFDNEEGWVRSAVALLSGGAAVDFQKFVSDNLEDDNLAKKAVLIANENLVSSSVSGDGILFTIEWEVLDKVGPTSIVFSKHEGDTELVRADAVLIPTVQQGVSLNIEKRSFPQSQMQHFINLRPNLEWSTYGGYVTNLETSYGDEVGVFVKNNEGSEILVGAAVLGQYLEDSEQYRNNGFILHIYQDDSTTEEKDGACPGDSLIFKVWSQKTGQETIITSLSYEKYLGINGENLQEIIFNATGELEFLAGKNDSGLLVLGIKE